MTDFNSNGSREGQNGSPGLLLDLHRRKIKYAMRKRTAQATAKTLQKTT